jgi:hypothetical protein
MSQIEIRQALEKALDSITPQISTAWENRVFEATEDVPYQRVHLMPAQPLNPEIGVGGFFQEQGIFQISLCYPLNNGPKDADARAELYRTVFYQGSQFTKGQTKVQVTRTPAISLGKADGDRWIVTLKIIYVANGLN